MNDDIIKITDETTPDEIMEIAIGLYARAMFRAGETQNNPQLAEDLADCFLNIAIPMKHDFMRKINQINP